MAGAFGRLAVFLAGVPFATLSAGAAPPVEASAADFVGSWGCILFRVGGGAGSGVCPAGWSRLDVAKDGSYRMGQVQGDVRVAAGKATFSGELTFMGPAEMTRPGQFEFQWTDAEGYRYWAVFITNRP
ncbi:MAG: hypothetical protein WCJ69_02725 [Betaproteobacteria bacterium]